MRLSRVLFFAPALFLLLSPNALARPRHSSVDEVWAREEAYWRFAQAGDVDSYLSLWHERFVGWPCGFADPGSKATIGNWVRDIRDQKVQLSYSLTREGAADFGNIVIVYYRTPVIRQFADGRTTGSGAESKFTHTWLRVGKTWQIIGGMCGPLVTPKQ